MAAERQDARATATAEATARWVETRDMLTSSELQAEYERQTGTSMKLQ